MFDIKENLKNLPNVPGVYLHKDILGQVIYVGKAISLRNRVRQYFQKGANENPKVKAMVENIREFEYITCSSEMEALILECNLIKKYRPKYNVLLRDDKTYPYIMVTTSEEYPRIIKTRIQKKDNNKYFGPYSDVTAVNAIIELLNNVLSLKKCSAKTFPKSHRECLNYHINQCMGMCVYEIDKEEYMKKIEKAIQFLNGKDKSLKTYLEQKMAEHSQNLAFEEATKYRDYITSLKAISESQRVSFVRGLDLDIILLMEENHQSNILMFSYRGGRLSSRETFNINDENVEDGQELISSFIKQYYSTWANIPPEIIVETPVADKEVLEEFLSKEGKKIKIIHPQKGDKKHILELAINDAKEVKKGLAQKNEIESKKRREIGQAIKEIIIRSGGNPNTETNKDGYRIESYDISNTNGVDTVGAMVVFQGLKPARKDYRRFKIKTIDGQNDYGSLEEVVRRRFKRAIDGDKAFNIIPDIILVDGGRGQVSAVLKSLKELNLSIPVAGMAKDDFHRTRAIVFPNGQETILKEAPMLFSFIGSIQEEVHRYAIDFHKKVRSKSTLTSQLDNIKGVGAVRRNSLLAHFDSIEKIKQASIDELIEVKGITRDVAEEIRLFFEKVNREH